MPYSALLLDHVFIIGSTDALTPIAAYKSGRAFRRFEHHGYGLGLAVEGHGGRWRDDPDVARYVRWWVCATGFSFGELLLSMDWRYVAELAACGAFRERPRRGIL